MPSMPAGKSRFVFTAAPHRMLFLAGALQLIGVMLLWIWELLAREGVADFPALTVPPLWAHMFLMIYGVFPFFIFGFLLTVYPRWMNAPAVPRSQYIAVFACQAAGMVIFYAGLFLSRQWLVVALGGVLLGWLVALSALARVYFSANNHGMHERALNLALIAGFVGLALYTYGLMRMSNDSLLLARTIGVWLFLVPVVFSVGHRMIPFFSSIVLNDYVTVRPAWSLPVMGVCVAGHAMLEYAGEGRWLFVTDLPLFAVALYHTLKWRIRHSLSIRLLGMLHISFAWLAVAMALYSIQSLGYWFGTGDMLGRAPVHALGIGFFTGIVVAMASRVTLGHSGRPLTADNLTWAVLLGVNITAILRILAELIPQAGGLINILAAVLWLLCLTPWVFRYAPVYLKPRVDGRPG